jgi:UDP-GlcNAc:undecaprenyl-phosphate GlcNAc-1-phosphate transferase
MEMTLFYTFVSSLLICIGLIPPLMRWAGPFHLLDMPGERKMHVVPVVRVGGIALSAGALASILFFAPMDREVCSYLIGAAIIVFFGVWDDRESLGFKTKFLVQLLAILIAVGYGGIRLKNIPFLDGTALAPWLISPLTVVVLLGITNAVNLSDGLDGLAGGLCLLSFGGLAYLAYLSGDLIVMIVSFSVLGSVLGFLRFNTHPAQIFMGDSGSQFLGFSAGVSAVMLSDPSRSPFSPILPLFIVGLPVLDTLMVMGHRLAAGRSPFLADKNHIHHKLLSVGFFHHEAVVIIYLFQTAMIGLAYLMRWQDDADLLAVYGLFAAAVFVFSTWAADDRWRWRRPAREDSISVLLMRRFHGSRFPAEVSLWLLGIGVLLFLGLGSFIPHQIPADFGFFAALLFGLLLGGFVIFRRAVPLLIRLGLYVVGSFLIYLSERGFLISGRSTHTMVNLFFVLMAVLVVIAIQLNRENAFRVTPLDFLVLLVAVIVPSLSEMRLGEIPLGLLVLKLTVLFFAYELILVKFSNRLAPLGMMMLWSLLILGVRAWVA